MSAQETIMPLAVSAHSLVINRRSSEQLERLSISSLRSQATLKAGGFKARMGLQNVARRTLGIFLLFVTVFLWTASNFLASSIFSDNSYSKPYLVTYINTSFFAFSLLPIALRLSHQHGFANTRQSATEYWRGQVNSYKGIRKAEEDESGDRMSASASRLLDDHEAVRALSSNGNDEGPEEVLGVPETAKLSLEFALLWFLANYLVAACLEYTSVASSTILTSTSSIWTLVFGAIFRVEQFSYKKLLGVLASLTGIVLISTIDLSGKDNDENRGNFPHKTQTEIAIGDAMAFGSAIMYGIYAIVMKKRIGNEDRVNMPLFFGLVGFFNVAFLWPGFFMLHYTGIETFEMPPTGRIWAIVLANSASSFVSDYCWAYAMLLTTPLVVTVGLSMTIPLSLIGQMLLSSQYSSVLYWVGSVIVLLSFLIINHESKEIAAPVMDDLERSHYENGAP
ncbi:hypothetical protein BJ878DRAFT_254950 [Calycina marina]|uniref:EamA domain-containing protein n=1 Tax=Calycina marina TaxID=1763456 RepID=A0A9P7YVZ7_9HELO|nr:hypothetical protein BJ878DRAFT_254950 [Calycina marina]